mmetsp:Transcript_24093/g.42775  ORF Transcript_24093/g.42775 Transcript_24093/m.42775 type:complete len:241 (-) Transcript_24093:215-937(-)
MEEADFNFNFKDLFSNFDQISNIFDHPAEASFQPGSEQKDFDDKAGGIFSFRDFDDAPNFEAPQKLPSPPKRAEVKKEEPQGSLKRSMPPHEDAPKSKLLKRETSLLTTPQVKEKPKLFTSERRSNISKQQTPKFTREAVESSVNTSFVPKPLPAEQVDGQLYNEELKRLEALKAQVDQLSSGPQTSQFISKCMVARGHYLAAELKIAQAQARIVGLINQLLALQTPELEVTLSELLEDN